MNHTNKANSKMTIQETKNKIEGETGIKVSVMKIKKGSMKGYVRFTPRKINGAYPEFPWAYCQSKVDLDNEDFYNVSNIFIFIGKEVFALSIDSKEFKEWRDWYIQEESESASCFNDKDIYSLFIMNS